MSQSAALVREANSTCILMGSQSQASGSETGDLGRCRKQILTHEVGLEVTQCHVATFCTSFSLLLEQITTNFMA